MNYITTRQDYYSEVVSFYQEIFWELGIDFQLNKGESPGPLRSRSDNWQATLNRGRRVMKLNKCVLTNDKQRFSFEPPPQPRSQACVKLFLASTVPVLC